MRQRYGGAKRRSMAGVNGYKAASTQFSFLEGGCCFWDWNRVVLQNSNFRIPIFRAVQIGIVRIPRDSASNIKPFFCSHCRNPANPPRSIIHFKRIRQRSFGREMASDMVVLIILLLLQMDLQRRIDTYEKRTIFRPPVPYLQFEFRLDNWDTETCLRYTR